MSVIWLISPLDYNILIQNLFFLKYWHNFTLLHLFKVFLFLTNFGEDFDKFIVRIKSQINNLVAI